MDLPYWRNDTTDQKDILIPSSPHHSKWQSPKSGPPAYRQHIARLHSIYPASRLFAELHDFFVSANEHLRATQVTVADCQHRDYSIRTMCTVEELQRTLALPSTGGAVRLVLVEYQSKRSLDRHMLDVLGTTFSLDPLFLYKHISLNRFGSETPFFASEQDGMELKLERNFVSSTICRAGAENSEQSPTGLFFTFTCAVL